VQIFYRATAARLRLVAGRAGSEKANHSEPVILIQLLGWSRLFLGFFRFFGFSLLSFSHDRSPFC